MACRRDVGRRLTYVPVHSQPANVPMPGKRGYATQDDQPLELVTGQDPADVAYFVDEIMTGGIVRPAGQFVRLDTAYGYGFLLARTRARMVRSGQSARGVIAVTAADTVYVIGELLADERAVHLVATSGVPGQTLQSLAVALALSVTRQGG